MERYNSYKDSGVKWLGEIPSHWAMLALKHILKLKKDIVGRRSSQYDLLSLTLKGVVKRDMENPEGKFPASFDTYQAVEPNNFIFCNFDNEETPRAVGLSPYKGMITGAYDVLSRKNPKLTDGFLIYYFLYIDDAKRFKPLYKGLRKTVPFDSFMSYKIPVPSLKEQAAIVSYLDTTTAKIDAAIAQQQKMIDLLNERKQIIINRAVTKGLNPNAKMKDSGVEWIGEVPEDWEIIKAKYIWNEYSEKTKTGNEQLLSVSQYGGVVPNNTESRSESFVGYKMVHKDILVINIMLAWMGGFDVSQIEGIVSPAYCTYRCDKKNALSKFLGYLYKSNMYLAEFARRSTGIIPSRWRMYTDDFGQVLTILPPIQSQKEIVEYIDTEIGKIIPYINKCQKQISLLQERKQIIINEVVTGKVKVTN